MRIPETMRTVFLFSLVVCGCRAQPGVSGGPVTFEGEWVISDYQERETVTHSRDGDVVTIRKTGDLYRVDAPDFVFDEARFSQSGNKLQGQTVQDYDGLKVLFSETPESVVRQAAASKTAVYRASLRMLGNGRVAAERSNLRIVYDASGRFRSFEHYQGWIRFTLTRK